MPIPVEIAGLGSRLSPVPDGRLVVLEGGPEPIKSSVLRTMATTAAASGRKVVLGTTRESPSMDEGEVPFVELADWSDLGLPARGDRDVFVDSFSFLMLGVPLAGIVSALRQTRAYARASDRCVVLAVEPDMLDATGIAAIRHMADGLMTFRVREDDEGSAHYVRVPRWTDGSAITENLFFEFDGGRLVVDTRSRIV